MLTRWLCAKALTCMAILSAHDPHTRLEKREQTLQTEVNPVSP